MSELALGVVNMNALCLAVALVLCWVPGAVTEDTCAEYRALHRKHTMCMVDRGSEIPLIDSDIDNILYNHNMMRSGALTVNAADMEKMVWDDELAAVAGKWARQCRKYSEKNSARRHVTSLSGIDIGQNILKYSKEDDILPISLAVQKWETPKDHFEYAAEITQEEADALLPYAQIIYSKAARVGCGLADCNATKVFVCNYARRLMNDPASVSMPYKKFVQYPCSSCNDVCDDYGYLCDCEGKICPDGKKLEFTRGPPRCNCK